MIILAVIAVLILAVSVWFLARPITRPAGAVSGEERHELMQQRGRLLTQLSDLDIETADRNMDAAVIGDERQRLEAELAQVLRRLESLASAAVVSADALPAHTRRMTLIALAILLPVAAIGLYAGKQAKTVEQLSQLGPGGQPDPFKMVARLEKRLESAPDDPAGWTRLGRSYAVLERFDDAKRAYSKAMQLAPDDVAILTDYATLLISENPRQPSKEALAAFTRLYQLNPKHPGALWVLGLDAYNIGKYKQAIKHWEALLKELPPDAEVAPQVRHVVEQARTKIKGKN
ncbi:MAG: tetratricopeptide repeat protein [Gammaproteobacteria bacterium]|nr:tetratricopeptide repeat protein [Gammaproteobacteria bacterium]